MPRPKHRTSRAKPPPHLPGDADTTNPIPVASAPGSDDPSPFSHATLDLQPFLNTTFSLHRASPLHVGAVGLSRPQLDLVAKRLRDTLVGDVVRGVRVGLEGDDSSLGAIGALLGVDMHWVDVESFLGKEGDRPEGSREDLEPEDGGNPEEPRRALWLDIGYESADCTAILLPQLCAKSLPPAPEIALSEAWKRPAHVNADASAGHPSFVDLPLLLMHMPASLKPIVTAFLSSNFDCHISNLRLGTRTLVRSWESWIGENPPPAGAKDVVVTLGFRLPAPPPADGVEEQEGNKDDSILGLKGIDVIIPAPDVAKFWNAGKSLATTGRDEEYGAVRKNPRKRRRFAAGGEEEGWHWRGGASDSGQSHQNMPITPGSTRSLPQQPFTEALARYIDKNLALDLFHPAVRISRISCSAFMLAEGRIKMFGAPQKRGDENPALEVPRGVWEFMSGLADRAAGGGGWDAGSG